ncbi:hypothetical protein AIOL_002566 [Candidatus Rhodobacter oscarellae]|uniref:Uncharacterized protein n=1 Tax=Candidatus Rhodobacter oscarellae TaxID=1675527 RepID=A0A0J9E461_9RHOB|nr:hypothetical protein AIOL_002566 [Candidatus Rhodobacter lobularis]
MRGATIAPNFLTFIGRRIFPELPLRWISASRLLPSLRARRDAV